MCMFEWHRMKGGSWKKKGRKVCRIWEMEARECLIDYLTIFLCVCVCAFISAYRLTPSTAYSKDLSWLRPVRRPSTFTLTTANQVHIYICVCTCVCLYCLKGERLCRHATVNTTVTQQIHTLTHSCVIMWPEFRQTEDWTVRCRYIIHKNIQEDPWNLPNSIKTLVESLQRFVDG